jgi:hypothetical protein
MCKGVKRELFELCSANKIFFYMDDLYMWNIFFLLCYTIFILFIYQCFFIKINPLWVLLDSFFDLSKREQEILPNIPTTIEFHTTKYKEILNQISEIVGIYSKHSGHIENQLEMSSNNNIFSNHEKEQMKKELRESIVSILSTTS